MSSATTKTPPPDSSHYSASHEALAVDLAGTKEYVKGLGEDVHEQGRRIGSMETEMRRGFQTVGSDIVKLGQEWSREANRISQPKGVQWPMVSVFLVGLLALASWANSYFGQGIAAATKAAQAAHEAQAALNGRIDLISNRQHNDSVSSARAEGYQDASTKASEKERDRLRLEIDRLHPGAKAPQ